MGKPLNKLSHLLSWLKKKKIRLQIFQSSRGSGFWPVQKKKNNHHHTIYLYRAQQSISAITQNPGGEDLRYREVLLNFLKPVRSSAERFQWIQGFVQTSSAWTVSWGGDLRSMRQQPPTAGMSLGTFQKQLRCLNSSLLCSSSLRLKEINGTDSGEHEQCNISLLPHPRTPRRSLLSWVKTSFLWCLPTRNAHFHCPYRWEDNAHHCKRCGPYPTARTDQTLLISTMNGQLPGKQAARSSQSLSAALIACSSTRAGPIQVLLKAKEQRLEKQ